MPAVHAAGIASMCKAVVSKPPPSYISGPQENVMPTTDRRTLDLAARLEHLAANVAAARDHIAREYAATDGIAAASINDGSRSTDNTSTTERTMLARQHLAGQAAQINDDLDTIEAIITSCQKTCTRAISTRAPAAEPAKCYIDPGLDGYLTPLHDGGFFDPTCNNLSRTTKPGPCNTCRVRLARFRAKHDLKPVTEDTTLDYEAKIVEGQRGAIHAYPISGAA